MDIDKITNMILAIGTTATAIGVAVNIVMTQLQNRTMKKIETNTNGMGERAEKSAAVAAEAVATLEITTENLKRRDPNATIIRKAEEVVAKAKQNDSSTSMTIPHN